MTDEKISKDEPIGSLGMEIKELTEHPLSNGDVMKKPEPRPEIKISQAPVTQADDELQRLKDALNDCEQRYRTLLETNIYGIQEIDILGNITYANDIQYEILGYEKGELEGKAVWELLASDEDRMELTDFLTKLAQKQYVPPPRTGGYLKADGGVLELKVDWATRHNDRGDIIGFLSITTDILDCEIIQQPEPVSKTDEIKSPVSAKIETERLILDHARELVLTLTMGGKIEYVNDAMVMFSGYGRKDLLDMKISDIMPSDQLSVLKKSIKTGATAGDILLKETMFITKDLKSVPVEISVSLIMDKDVPSNLLVVARDISRRGSVKPKLHSEISERLEPTMTFMEGLVEDLNQLLTGILGNIDLAQIKMRPEDGGYKWLSEAKSGCTGLKELMRKFNIIAKGMTSDRETGALNQNVRRWVKSSLKNSRLSCAFSIPDDLWMVVYDETQMRIIFEILVQNAVDAMPKGGNIVISAGNVTVGEDNKYQGMVIPRGDYVRVSIRDKGSGIDEEDLPRIFDPYFTRRNNGDPGRGLGMTIAYSLIQRLSGHIQIQSRPGSHTVVTLFFPATREIASKKKPKNKQPHPIAEKDKEKETANRQKKGETFDAPKADIPRKATVLVMDDDVSISQVAGDILKKMGCTVVFARNGNEAVEFYEYSLQSGTRFDAVILELNIKKGPGARETVTRLAEIDTGVKAIVTGSYSSDPEMVDYAKYGFCDVIEKPYSFIEFEKVLERVLPVTA